MKRTLVLAGMLAAVMIVTAYPAQAKFEHSTIVISGPRERGAPFADLSPIRLTGDGSMSWIQGTRLLEGGFAAPSDTRTLGPAFPVLVYLDCREAHRGVTVVRQILYPYAADGPKVETPAGQGVCGWFRTAGGWATILSSLFDRLVSAGLPRTLAVRAAAPTTTGGGGSGSALVAGAGFAALGALILLGAGASVVQRRRRRLAPLA